jgi:hypothetical protein
VQRWLKFAKYLRDFGWEPVIYCPANPEYPETDPSLFKDIPEGMEILTYPVWEPYRAYKKLLGQKKDEKINAAFLSEKKKNRLLEGLSIWIRGNLFIPDARKFWIRPSVNYLKNYIEKKRPDVIISTGPPHSTHLIALRLAGSFSVPWLADFRDPWTNIDFYKDLKLTSWADKKHRRLELDVLRLATAVTVISRSMAGDFKKLHDRPYSVITNGFDTADTERPMPERDQSFSIAHIGTLAASRNPLTLWEALHQLLIEQPLLANDLEIKLVGRVDYTVTESIETFGLSRFVNKIEYLPHDKVVQCQQQSQVLLLVINNTPNSGMILTGKFFEYLAAKRPILCLGPPGGDAARILSETRSGLLAGFGDVDTMKSHLLHFYEKYKNNSLIAQSQGIEHYSRRELTRKLATVLNEITA